MKKEFLKLDKYRGDPALEAKRVRAVWEWQNPLVEFLNAMVLQLRTITNPKERDLKTILKGKQAARKLNLLDIPSKRERQ